MKQHCMVISLQVKPVTICLWLLHNKFQASMPVISVALTTPHMPAV